jgi:hypothetical protein
MDTVGTFEMAKALAKVSIFRQLTKVRKRSFQTMREGYRVAGSRIISLCWFICRGKEMSRLATDH